ncbi:hypothetical protein AAT19DRAFT_11753 [Rhodotorula toruloides]|uniref:Uncharacterized protein n=1 Tax=Rhodotorula toruloides TaxID=5286 RepID=A0A2S9ZWF9_RHOTO|nr:hypothetical protein AAT19DRAFT_11753 [Rhodotorula toruloides]
MLPTALVFLSTTLALSAPLDSPAQLPFLPSSLSSPPPLDISNSTRLPLTLGVMSLCPDARLCESVMDRVFEQVTSVAIRSEGKEGGGGGGGKKEGKVRVGELVKLRVEFIASRNSSAPYGTTCKHGDRECRGNVQQLCAERYWGAEGAWEFIQCLNYDPNARIGSEQAARECGRLIGREWTEKLQSCVDGEEGRKLARKSAKRLSKVGVEKSCSILHPRFDLATLSVGPRSRGFQALDRARVGEGERAPLKSGSWRGVEGVDRRCIVVPLALAARTCLFSAVFRSSSFANSPNL